MNNNKRLIISIMAILLFGGMIAGGTFAWARWQISTEQQTAIVFTVTSGFTCSADGGGNITPGDIKLAPASCIDKEFAIKRTVTVSPTFNNMEGRLFMDLWLKVNSIDSGLAASQNFKYALTTSSSSCTTGIVTQGNFNGATTNTIVPLLDNKIYSQTTNDTYYLWIWLDEAETNINTMNQSFSMELGGVCTNNPPGVQTYTVNTNSDIQIGAPIHSKIPQYNTPSEAITALETIYSEKNNEATTSLPFFLKHTIVNLEYINDESHRWLLYYESEWGDYLESSLYGSYSTESECNQQVEWYGGDSSYKCFNNAVNESYVGFVVNEDMVSANPDMTAGTYYLKGGDGGVAYNDNITTLTTAFGSSNCDDYTNEFVCYANGLMGSVYSSGEIQVYDGDNINDCHVRSDGYSACYVTSGA